MPADLPVMEFKSRVELRDWLTQNNYTSPGIWIRVFNKRSKVESVTFEELLDEGLCFGWSESMRRAYDDVSYLQRFTPRKTKGTTSRRNQEHVRTLITNGRMTDYGLNALGIQQPDLADQDKCYKKVQGWKIENDKMYFHCNDIKFLVAFFLEGVINME